VSDVTATNQFTPTVRRVSRLRHSRRDRNAALHAHPFWQQRGEPGVKACARADDPGVAVHDAAGVRRSREPRTSVDHRQARAHGIAAIEAAHPGVAHSGRLLQLTPTDWVFTSTGIGLGICALRFLDGLSESLSSDLRDAGFSVNRRPSTRRTASALPAPRRRQEDTRRRSVSIPRSTWTPPHSLRSLRAAAGRHWPPDVCVMFWTPQPRRQACRSPSEVASHTRAFPALNHWCDA
jgi:hypothetical protein